MVPKPKNLIKTMICDDSSLSSLSLSDIPRRDILANSAMEDGEGEDEDGEGLTLTEWSESESDDDKNDISTSHGTVVTSTNTGTSDSTTRVLPIPMSVAFRGDGPELTFFSDNTYCQTFGQDPIRISGMDTKTLQEAITDENEKRYAGYASPIVDADPFDRIVRNALWSRGHPRQAINPALASTDLVQSMSQVRGLNQTLMLAPPFSGPAPFYSVMKIHGTTSLCSISRISNYENTTGKIKTAKFGVATPLADDWNHAVHYIANLYGHGVYQVQTHGGNILFRTAMLEQTGMCVIFLFCLLTPL